MVVQSDLVDGHLYVGLETGGGEMIKGNGQNFSSPLGAILRLNAEQKASSLDNPFVGVQNQSLNKGDAQHDHCGDWVAQPLEPHCYPMDDHIANVGQNAFEEISIAERDNLGGMWEHECLETNCSQKMPW